MRSKLKIRLFKISLALSLGCTLFVLFWSIPPGEKILKRIISKQLSRALKMEVVIHDLETNIFNRIHMQGLTISVEKDSAEMVSLNELLINFRLLSLFHKNIQISNLAMSGLHTNMDIIQSDSLIRSRHNTYENLLNNFRSPFKMSIDRLILFDAKIAVKNEHIPLNVLVEDLTIKASPFDKDTIAYSLNLKKGCGYYQKSFLKISGCQIEGIHSARLLIDTAIFKIDTVQVDSHYVSEMAANVQLENEKINVSSFQSLVWGGILSGSGQLGMEESQQGYISLNLKGIQLPQVQSSFNQKLTLIEGHLNGVFHASGKGSTFRDWKAAGELNLSDIQTQKQQFPSYRIDFQYTDEKMDLTLSHEASSIAANIQLQQNGFHGTISLSVPKIEPLSSFFQTSPIYGSLFGEGQINYIGDNSTIDFYMQASNLQFQQYQLDSLCTHMEYSQNRLSIHDFQVIHPSGWNQKQDTAYDNVPFALRLNGEFNTQNRTGLVRASIYPAEKTPISFDTDSSWGDILCEMAVSESQIQTIQVWGEVKNLSVIKNFLTNLPTLQGQLTMQTEYSRNHSDHHMILRSKVNHPLYQNQVLADSLLLEIHVQNNLIDPIQLTIYQNGRQHQIESIIESDQNLFDSNFSQIAHTRGSIQLDSLDLQWIRPWLPDSLETVGFIDADINWEGRFPDLHPVGLIVLNGDIYHPVEQIHVDNLYMAISVQDTLAEIPTGRFALQSIPVSLKAQFYLSKDNSLKLHADTDVYNQKALSINGIIQKDSIQFVNTLDQFPISLFEPLNPEIRYISGMIDANVNISGTNRSPMINGELTIQDMTFSPPWSEIPFSNGYFHLFFTGNQLHLDTLVLVQNQGHIGSSGFLTITGNKLSQLTLKTDLSTLRVMKRKQYDIQIQNAHFEMTNKGETYVLTGLVMLDKSVIQNAITPTDIMQKMQTRDRPSMNRPDYFQKIEMDIRIQESENLWVDNNLVKVRLHPELRVMGNLNNIRLGGRVTVREGYLLYLDRKFKINRGILDFIDPNRINPEMDLIAVHQLSGHQSSDQKPYAITLSIQGPLDQARLQLSSEPYLNEADILTLLTVGSTGQAITDRSSATLTVVDLLKERAASLSNERLINYASRTVNETLKFAEITIAGNVFRQDDESPTVTASRNLFQKITITYSTRIGHINDQSIRLNYHLHDRLMLQGETDRYGRSGLDLIYGIGIQ
ncbi:translocation/assembly module TamB domain-containing protein [bacterium]|nr:translocation/assembly module TamB domain-containing protein [bacterium]RQV95527.1 MAG: hypothetical protein EH221_06020 [bacterium]